MNPLFGIVDAYEHLAPIVDTDAAMSWLMTTIQQKGAHFIIDTVRGDLFPQEDEIRAKLDVDVIVNATGLGGTELAGDTTCCPLRGALIRIFDDGKRFDKVSKALKNSFRCWQWCERVCVYWSLERQYSSARGHRRAE